MEHNELLDKVMQSTEWYECAKNIQAQHSDMIDLTAERADLLTQRVVFGVHTVGELRAGVAWVNALDAEASRYDIDWTIASGDAIEAIARRIANHAGRAALARVRTQTRLDIETVRYKRLATLD